MTATQTRPTAAATNATRWANARARGAALIGQVVRVGRDRFTVPSQSEAGAAYTVTLEGHPAHVRCECPAALADQPCKHAEAVRAWVKRHNAQVAARRVTPVRRCQACWIAGDLFEGPGGRLLCGQCVDGEQRAAGARRRGARAA